MAGWIGDWTSAAELIGRKPQNLLTQLRQALRERCIVERQAGGTGQYPPRMWLGEWDSSFTYYGRDVVTRDGTLYTALTQTNNVNQDPLTETDYWTPTEPEDKSVLRDNALPAEDWYTDFTNTLQALLTTLDPKFVCQDEFPTVEAYFTYWTTDKVLERLALGGFMPAPTAGKLVGQWAVEQYQILNLLRWTPGVFASIDWWYEWKRETSAAVSWATASASFKASTDWQVGTPPVSMPAYSAALWGLKKSGESSIWYHSWDIRARHSFFTYYVAQQPIDPIMLVFLRPVSRAWEEVEGYGLQPIDKYVTEGEWYLEETIPVVDGQEFELDLPTRAMINGHSYLDPSDVAVYKGIWWDEDEEWEGTYEWYFNTMPVFRYDHAGGFEYYD